MSQIDNEVLKDFMQESMKILDECEGILEEIENDSKSASKLEVYANKIDRIMGGAKSIYLMSPDKKELQYIGNLTEACKALGYRGAKTGPWPDLFNTTVSFLLDTNSVLCETILRLEKSDGTLNPQLYNSLVERLTWISEMYNRVPGLSDLLKNPGMSQTDVDELIEQLKKK